MWPYIPILDRGCAECRYKAPYSAFLGHTVKLIDGAGDPDSTEGHIERLYWRGEELWIRLRTRDGTWRSIPWQQTDLPRLTATALPRVPPLSPPVLLELAQHLQRRGQSSNRVHPPASWR